MVGMRLALLGILFVVMIMLNEKNGVCAASKRCDFRAHGLEGTSCFVVEGSECGDEGCRNVAPMADWKTVDEAKEACRDNYGGVLAQFSSAEYSIFEEYYDKEDLSDEKKYLRNRFWTDGEKSAGIWHYSNGDEVGIFQQGLEWIDNGAGTCMKVLPFNAKPLFAWKCDTPGPYICEYKEQNVWLFDCPDRPYVGREGDACWDDLHMAIKYMEITGDDTLDSGICVWHNGIFCLNRAWCVKQLNVDITNCGKVENPVDLPSDLSESEFQIDYYCFDDSCERDKYAHMAGSCQNSYRPKAYSDHWCVKKQHWNHIPDTEEYCDVRIIKGEEENKKCKLNL